MIFDPENGGWTRPVSIKGRNTPFAGWKLKEVIMTLVNGVRFSLRCHIDRKEEA